MHEKVIWKRIGYLFFKYGGLVIDDRDKVIDGIKSNKLFFFYYYFYIECQIWWITSAIIISLGMENLKPGSACRGWYQMVHVDDGGREPVLYARFFRFAEVRLVFLRACPQRSRTRCRPGR